MERQISPDEVRMGMYIRRFGGSWFSHPFWRAHFVVETERDLQRVHESGVPYVVIDEALGASLPLELGKRLTTQGQEACRPSRRISERRPGYSDPKRIWNERDQAIERADRGRAKALVTRSKQVLEAAFADVRLGRAVRMEEVTGIVDDIVDMVDRSPRTLLEILRLKRKDEYTYLHSVAVCTLMVNAGRHMGRSAQEIRDYGLAGLLHDLGKMDIPEQILNKAGKLTPEEYRRIQEHPEQGFRILSQSPNMPEMALDVCRHHHEKMDGSGYPFGLSADAITLVSRLGAVCDVYDALTSERTYKSAWNPAEAIAAMWSWEGHFDKKVLFSFMQSVAVFPPGLLVQLRSNRLAIVLENKRRNSRPRVHAFYDTRARRLTRVEEIVIQDNLANDSIIAAAQPEEWNLQDWPQLMEEVIKCGGSPSKLPPWSAFRAPAPSSHPKND